MSILIKGMEMPKCCGDCRFKWHGDSTTYCLALSKLHDLYRINNVYYSIDDNCPLIEIPTKHGRLIDVDMIEIPETRVGVFENCQSCQLLKEEQVKEIIFFAPTIIEAEE